MAIAIDAAENTAAWFLRVSPIAVVSWSLWVRFPITSAGNPSLLNLFDGGTQRANAYLDRGPSPDELILAVNRVGVGFRFVRLAASNAIADGAWHHLAGTYDAAAHTATCWLDGVAQATAVLSSGGTAPSADSAQMDDTGATGWTTDIADLALWFDAAAIIDAAAVARLYSSPRMSARDGAATGGRRPDVHQPFLGATAEWGQPGAASGSPTYPPSPAMTI